MLQSQLVGSQVEETSKDGKVASCFTCTDEPHLQLPGCLQSINTNFLSFYYGLNNVEENVEGNRVSLRSIQPTKYL